MTKITKENILKKGAKLRTDSPQMYFAKMIKEFREKRGLTQEELAEAVGKSRVNIVNLEQGKINPPINDLYIMCCAINCQVSDLFPKIIPFKKQLTSPKGFRYPIGK